MKLRIGISIVLAFVAAMPASAQTADQFGMYAFKTDKGCVFYDTIEPDDQASAIWTGNCAAGQPISGSGTLIKLIFELTDGTLWGMQITGTMTGGVFDGQVARLSVLSEPAQATCAVKMTIHACLKT